MVIEGDEYLTSPIDRVPKFHKYHPHIAVISGIGWDHVNVFPTFDSYLEQFRIYVDTIEEGGCLIFDKNDIEAKKIADTAKVPTYGYDIHQYQGDGENTYLVYGNNKIKVQIFGEHNMKNINAAYNVCKQLGVSDEVFYEAISTFKGASRRLELMFENKEKNNLVFRDFAHAPSKVLATVKALREQYSERYLLVVFELHTYSSLSEVFIDHYKHCLDNCDKAIVFYDPHAVAIKKLELMSDERIIEGFARTDIQVVHSKVELMSVLESITKENIVGGFMSSGDFNGLTKEDLVMLF
jgi:UDP-N-acetylmuramate-alanine ligase